MSTWIQPDLRSRLLSPLRHKLQDSLRAGLGLLFPARCAYCGEDVRSDGELLLCESCQTQLAPPRRPCCLRCGERIPPHENPSDGCQHCRPRRLRFDRTVFLGQYEGELRTAVLRMKHLTEGSLASVIGQLFWQQQASELTALKADVLVPIPMHWLRRARRGANSPETVAEVLARRLRVPAEPRLLCRKKNTQPQGSLSSGQRLENLRGAFRLRRGYDCRGVRVVLVDDILTTGATCNAAARMLLAAGAESVAVAVIARAEGSAV